MVPKYRSAVRLISSGAMILAPAPASAVAACAVVAAARAISAAAPESRMFFMVVFPLFEV
jgi:hypothetical protein